MDALRLLLVDDETDFLEPLVKRLRKRNVETAAVENGEQALRYLETHPVDVVLLDVRMPGIDGISTLKAIKERHPRTEVIMLTGHADVEAAVRGMELGAFDYLMKPMDVDEILYKALDAHKKKVLHGQRTGVEKRRWKESEPKSESFD